MKQSCKDLLYFVRIKIVDQYKIGSDKMVFNIELNEALEIDVIGSDNFQHRSQWNIYNTRYCVQVHIQTINDVIERLCLYRLSE